MRKFSVSVAEAFSSGAILIPRMTFACILAISHHLDFVLAFILLYSFEKAGVYMIQGFGKINNPYPILERTLEMMIGGALLCMLFTGSMWLFDLGALLIGLGLSNYASLFQTIKDRQKENGTWNYGKSRLYGYIIELIIVTFTYFFVKKMHEPISLIFAVLLVIFLIIRIMVSQIKKDDVISDEKAFVHRDRSWRFFIPAMLMLATTLVVKVLRQNADPYMLTYVAIGFCVIILISFFYSKTRLSNYTLQTIWFGEVRNYVLSFSLIFFLATDKTYMLLLTYIMTILSMIISVWVEPKIKAKMSNYDFNRLCIFGAVASAFLLWNMYTYLIGVFMAGFFAIMGNRINAKYFKQKEDIPILERRTVTAKLHNFGGIAQQTILLSVIVTISFIMYGNGAVGLQAFHMKSDIQLEQIFYYTKLVVSFILLFNSLIIIRGVKKCEKK